MRFKGMALLLAGALVLSGQAGAEQGSDSSEMGMSGGSVIRALFTTTVIDREPQDSVAELLNDSGKILFFTEFAGMAGQTAIHRWEYAGQVMAEIPFEIGAQRWRAWSSKNLDPSWTGKWRVTAVDNSGNELISRKFELMAPAASAPAAMQ